MSGILLASVGNSYGSLPVNIAVPTISGTVTQGSTLTSTTGTWTGAPAPTFTYQWQRGTNDISGATNNTYTIQAADATNTLRCVVTATNPLGAVSANSANTTTVPLVIGQAFEGGYYAGAMSSAGNGVADFYLILSSKSSGQANRQAKTSNTSTSGTSSEIDGPTNSANMNNATHPAAQFCEGRTIGGYTDWYMPARKELAQCYYAFKPTTDANSTSGVTANSYAVPARGAYTNSPSDPARTTVTDFISGGTQAFDLGVFYNSSTENSSSAMFSITFSNGNEGGFESKVNTIPVRAVRRVAV